MGGGPSQGKDAGPINNCKIHKRFVDKSYHLLVIPVVGLKSVGGRSEFRRLTHPRRLAGRNDAH